MTPRSISTSALAATLARRAAVPLTLTVFLTGMLGALAVGGVDAAAPLAFPPPPKPVSADETAGAVHRAVAPAMSPVLPAAAVETVREHSPTKSAAAPMVGRVARELRVRAGDTLIDLLRRSGLAYPQAVSAVASIEDVFDPRNLRVGQTLALETERTDEGTQNLVSLKLNLDFASDLRLERAKSGAFAAAEVPRPSRTEVRVASAEVEDSLYNAAKSRDVPDAALMEVIKLFSYDIDFQRDIQPGDGLEMVYEIEATADGKERRTGNLLHAAIRSGDKTFTAYRFEDGDDVAYYDAAGRSLKKWLMRTPIDGARLSSGFGKRRHPVLGYTKMHKGTDFAAPSGTPIYAAGDGVIDAIGRKGGYGNYIRIRHNSEFGTAYAHMKGFKAGLKRGARVKQGEIIGYVGTTGRSTGPHLHYEVLKNGVQINPMSLKPQTLAKLEGGALRRFEAQVAKIEARKGTARRQYAQVR